MALSNRSTITYFYDYPRLEGRFKETGDTFPRKTEEGIGNFMRPLLHMFTAALSSTTPTARSCAYQVRCVKSDTKILRYTVRLIDWSQISEGQYFLRYVITQPPDRLLSPPGPSARPCSARSRESKISICRLPKKPLPPCCTSLNFFTSRVVLGRKSLFFEGKFVDPVFSIAASRG